MIVSTGNNYSYFSKNVATLTAIVNFPFENLLQDFGSCRFHNLKKGK